jgi:hypothetical protein
LADILGLPKGGPKERMKKNKKKEEHKSKTL